MTKVLIATFALLVPVVSARADDKSPPAATAGTTTRAGSGSDLKGTTTAGTTLRAGSGSDLKGTTQRGTTLSGTTTRAGSGAAAGMTMGSSTPGSADAAHAGAAARVAGHGSDRWWNESYYGGPVVARSLTPVLVVPAAAETAVVSPTPAPSGTGTVRVVDRGFAARDATPVPATPTAYERPVSVPAAPVVEASSTWYGPASGAYAGARLGTGSFGGIGTYSGYETWGPVPGPVGLRCGCDGR